MVHGHPGTGEIACVPPMACIANAIYNATGVRVTKLPLSPENVLRALKEAGKRSGISIRLVQTLVPNECQHRNARLMIHKDSGK